MSDSVPSCCGRSMTVIGMDRDDVGVQLHSCPGCGRHAWRRDGREVDRSELLDVLRSTAKQPRPAAPRAAQRPRRPAATPGRPAATPGRAAAGGPPAGGSAAVGRTPPRSAPTEPARDARREELQRMLARFTVHGTTP